MATNRRGLMAFVATLILLLLAPGCGHYGGEPRTDVTGKQGDWFDGYFRRIPQNAIDEADAAPGRSITVDRSGQLTRYSYSRSLIRGVRLSRGDWVPETQGFRGNDSHRLQLLLPGQRENITRSHSPLDYRLAGPEAQPPFCHLRDKGILL